MAAISDTPTSNGRGATRRPSTSDTRTSGRNGSTLKLRAKDATPEQLAASTCDGCDELIQIRGWLEPERDAEHRRRFGSRMHGRCQFPDLEPGLVAIGGKRVR
jgi:hypothetical protein